VERLLAVLQVFLLIQLRHTERSSESEAMAKEEYGGRWKPSRRRRERGRLLPQAKRASAGLQQHLNLPRSTTSQNQAHNSGNSSSYPYCSMMLWVRQSGVATVAGEDISSFRYFVPILLLFERCNRSFSLHSCMFSRIIDWILKKSWNWQGTMLTSRECNHQCCIGMSMPLGKKGS
jgi:hypothetical protein